MLKTQNHSISVDLHSLVKALKRAYTIVYTIHYTVHTVRLSAFHLIMMSRIVELCLTYISFKSNRALE